ncbi:MAG: TIGR04255 family protein [Bacteroidales bacterium]|nr:TIGR04255 family protein [Bacteroidales bacterium]
MNKLPLSLNKCPLVDALIEIRFVSSIIDSAIFGIIYNIIRDEYKGEVTNLPILQVPEQIRKSDPNLKFKPLYRIESEKYIVQIGDDVLTISSKMPYVGWSDFSSHTINLINKIANENIFDKIIRVGHRYINFFEGDIMDKLTISTPRITGYQTNNILIRTEIQDDNNFIDTVQITNSATYKSPLHKSSILGSIIDIDSSKEYIDNYFLENLGNEIKQLHVCEKKMFFSLLKKEFLDSLSPVY